MFSVHLKLLLGVVLLEVGRAHDAILHQHVLERAFILNRQVGPHLRLFEDVVIELNN